MGKIVLNIRIFSIIIAMRYKTVKKNNTNNKTCG